LRPGTIPVEKACLLDPADGQLPDITIPVWPDVTIYNR
jgi:hypothetical protein